jgi:hypothetical protein
MKDQTTGADPLYWVRPEEFCRRSGTSLHTVRDWIKDGVWAEGYQYKRTGPRTTWVNLHKVNEWVEKF